MAYKILIMGLSGTGKTTLAIKIIDALKKKGKVVEHLNADEIRKKYNDWDFSKKGRIEQSIRLSKMANQSKCAFVVCDFIAPLKESRFNFAPNFLIWIDTKQSSKYTDTDQMFEKPSSYNYKINDYNDDHVSKIIMKIFDSINSIKELKHNYSILPYIQIPELSNMNLEYTGMDMIEKCIDKSFFMTYNKHISYNYNSRGFRDNEWQLDLSNTIWCVGDSYTSGIGLPLEETWPKVLEQQCDTNCINISLDGASVNWISRQVLYILNEINPSKIVIQWSFLHRREIDDTQLSDKNRRISYGDATTSDSDDIKNLLNCIRMIEKNKNKSLIIHSFIPCISTMSSNELTRIITDEFKNILIVSDNEQIDFARDKFHYGYLTVLKYVKHYTEIL